MKTINFAVALLILVLTAGAFAQSAPAPERVNSLASAIADAEGFGVRGVIPTRYHNPGDLKTIPAAAKLPGQKSIGKGGHVVFKSDAAGWAALKDQIAKMVDGRSKHFNADMTFAQVAKRYAGNWRPWVKIVTKELGVTPNTTLGTYLLPQVEEPVPPSIQDLGVQADLTILQFDGDLLPKN
jgi:hypothetical protein